MNSFIKWAGSKKQLLPVIAESMPMSYNRYIEPFAGSACLFFQLTPNRSILGDINIELINTYKALKENVHEVIRHLYNLKDSKEEFYRLRSINPSDLNNSRSAARFIYLNRFCFNGLYRTNQQGIFNVPYGQYKDKTNRLPPPETLISCSQALQKTVLIAGTFEKTISRAKERDFIYLDPPYCIKSRQVFNQYSNFSFDEYEIEKLKIHLDNLNNIGVSFMVSYAYSNEGLFLAKGYNSRAVMVKRNISGFASHRRKSKELIITNY